MYEPFSPSFLRFDMSDIVHPPIFLFSIFVLPLSQKGRSSPLHPPSLGKYCLRYSPPRSLPLQASKIPHIRKLASTFFQRMAVFERTKSEHYTLFKPSQQRLASLPAPTLLSRYPPPGSDGNVRNNNMCVLSFSIFVMFFLHRPPFPLPPPLSNLSTDGSPLLFLEMYNQLLRPFSVTSHLWQEARGKTSTESVSCSHLLFFGDPFSIFFFLLSSVPPRLFEVRTNVIF